MIRLLLLFLFIVFSFGCAESAFASSRDKNILSDKERKEAVELSRLYSETLLQRFCLDSEVEPFTGTFDFDKERDPVTYQKFQAACQCLSEQALERLTGEEVLNYLQVFYGYTPLEKEKEVSALRQKYVPSNEAEKFRRVFYDPQSKKKCGFKK